MESKLELAFPTPIGFFVVPDNESLNQELKRIILDREQSEGGMQRSNVGGWHSGEDLLTWPCPEMELLQNALAKAVHFMGQKNSNDASQRIVFQLQAWANVCRHGDYHSLHNHPDSIWSGVYYVEAGSDAPGRPLSGQLEFLDPRSGVNMVSAPGTPFGRSMFFKPQSGALLLFPSWLYHQVHPYFGEGMRISISFNASLPPGAERKRA